MTSQPEQTTTTVVPRAAAAPDLRAPTTAPAKQPEVSVHPDLRELEHVLQIGEEPSDPSLFLKCVAVSDTHGLEQRIPYMPQGDVLIHAGDFTNVGELSDITAFNQWIGHQLRDNFRHCVFIAGNHDIPLDAEYYKDRGGRRFHKNHRVEPSECRAALTNGTYLDNSGCVIEGVSFWGSPWSPEFCDWAFNESRGALGKIWQQIPDQTDVVITHGPASMHGDLCLGGSSGNAGCKDLLRRIQSMQPQFAIAGHIHEGYGVTVQPDCKTVFINASTCTIRYKPTNKPIVFWVRKPTS